MVRDITIPVLLRTLKILTFKAIKIRFVCNKNIGFRCNNSVTEIEEAIVLYVKETGLRKLIIYYMYWFQ